jgi:hypothetical protein
MTVSTLPSRYTFTRAPLSRYVKPARPTFLLEWLGDPDAVRVHRIVRRTRARMAPSTVPLPDGWGSSDCWKTLSPRSPDMTILGSTS